MEWHTVFYVITLCTGGFYLEAGAWDRVMYRDSNNIVYRRVLPGGWSMGWGVPQQYSLPGGDMYRSTVHCTVYSPSTYV
jgi:hypothetical protein